jgi:hypothetical protein
VDHLITKSDLEQAMQGVALRLGTVERQQLEDRKLLLDNDERWLNLSKTLSKRTVLSAAAITALGVVIVAIIQAVSNYSFAVAREQVREMNRQDRSEELKQLSAHDELLIKRQNDELESRLQWLIVKGKQP